MMAATLIQYVDVNQQYFGIDNFDFGRFACIFDDEKGLQIAMNHVISKTNAIEKARQIFFEEQNEFTKLYVSADAMKLRYMKDCFGNRIFSGLSEDISGWLFLFDPVPFANWEHPCKYLFIVNYDYYVMVNYERGVADTVRLEEIY